MDIKRLLHTIKMVFVRWFERRIPYVSEAKDYGNYGEDRFVSELRRYLPDCKIKRNVLISAPDGNAEIDCLVLYKNKLFAVEVKRWKGRLVQQGDHFYQQKVDRWTGEIHTKVMRSPFKQLGRAIHLLRQQIPVKAWVNGIVFFNKDELEFISSNTEDVWFYDLSLLANYIRDQGKETFGNNADPFFERCTSADCLYAKNGDSLNCIVQKESIARWCQADPSAVESVYVEHHWSYDKVYIRFINGTASSVECENAKIRVDDNGRISEYSLCKLNHIVFGKII